MNTFVGLGSNLGDRAAWLRAGVAGLAASGLEPRALSGVWETAPIGVPFTGGAGEDSGGEDEPRPFLNMVVGCDTVLAPREALERLLAIEARAGRTRTVPNAPRTLDLDLLWMADIVVDEPGLTLPHPRMWERRFVLEPLAEIANGLRHPVSGSAIAEACIPLRATQPARRLGELGRI